MSSLSKFDICILGGVCVACVTVGSCVTYYITTRGRNNVNSGTADVRGRVTEESLVRGEISQPEGVDETDSDVAKQLEKEGVHKKLILYLNDEIGSAPESRFPEMVFISGDQLGTAKALECKNFQELAVQLQIKGILSVGNYDGILKIFAQSGYANEMVIQKIRDTAKSIQMLDEVDGPSTSTVPSSGPGFKYDGIILYTEDDRDVAIQFKTDIHTVMKGDLNVMLQEESGFGGQSKLSVSVEDSMYIYVMVTTNLSQNALTLFIVYATLIHLIQKSQWRVVPVMCTPQAKSPKELDALVDQKYYLYNDERYRSIFEAGFRNHIKYGKSGKFLKK